MFNLENDIAKIGKDMDAIRDRSPNPESEPAFVRLKKSLQDATAKRDALCTQLQPTIAEELKKQMLRKLDGDWERDDREIAMLNKSEEVLRTLVDHDQTKFADTGRSAVTLERIREEKDRIEPFAKKAAYEVEALKTESQATSRIRPLDDPFVEKRVGLAAMAATGSGLGSFALVVLAVAFLEFRGSPRQRSRRRFSRPEAASRRNHAAGAAPKCLRQERAAESPRRPCGTNSSSNRSTRCAPCCSIRPGKSNIAS